MVILSKQERSNGDVTSTLLLKNGRASSPTIFSKNFASGSVLSILLLTDTVYFTLPYLNNVNLKMNEVMKVMAVVTCLLAPATVIGGIFGMNFTRIPWLHNDYGFFIAVTIMLVVPVCMIFVFKKKGWF